MIERQVPPIDDPEFLKIHALLREVETIVDLVENSILYIKFWAQKGGWKLDFDAVEMRRQKERPKSHPCMLLQPYIVEVPISGASLEAARAPYRAQAIMYVIQHLFLIPAD